MASLTYPHWKLYLTNNINQFFCHLIQITNSVVGVLFCLREKKNIEHNFEIHILLLLTLFSSMKNDISSELFHAKALIVQQNQTHKINHCLHWNSGGKNSQIHLQPCCYINYWCPDKYMYVDIRILNQSSIQNTSNESINHKFKFSISPFVIDLNFVNVLTNNMYLPYRKQFIVSNPIIASLYVIPCSIEWFIIYAKKGEMSPLHNPYIWTKYSLFNRKNIKWCFTMCTLSDKKKGNPYSTCK